jgi:hypothetical protein
VQFRVLASDGFNSAEAHSGTIAVADKAPHVHLAWPTPGQRVLADQLLFLRGLASDPEDGPLSDQGLTWRVDGRVLARGGMVGTDALRPGSHQISLEARDAQGNLARAEVSITVVDTSGNRIYLPLVTMPK